MKIFSDKYYYIVAIIAAYFVFNFTVRDKLINWMVNPFPDKPITENANAYVRETAIRNFFVYSSLLSLIVLLALSLVLLFSKHGNGLNKVVLAIVSLTIALFLFSLVAIGGFSNGWP